jgi:hypothetical protein
MAQDESLRQLHDELSAVDRDLKAYAAQVAFCPRLSLTAEPTISRSTITWAALALLAMRVATKLLPLSLATCQEVLALALILGWALPWAIQLSGQSWERLVSKSAAESA